MDATIVAVPTRLELDRGEEIPVLRPRLPEAARLLPYLERIDRQRTYSNFGPLCLDLQDRLANDFRLPSGSVVCTSSGTTALMGAILTAVEKFGSDRRLAVCPAFTFVASALAAERCGFDVSFADVHPESWQIEPDRIRRHPRFDDIGLVIPVSPFGRPVEIAKWERFQAETGVPVVIDGAACFASLMESPGTWLGSVPVAVSFHATKSFGAGEGGAALCSDLGFIEAVTSAINFGFATRRECQCPSLNGKMSEYHAAVGLAEHDGWPRKLAALTERVSRYRDAFTRRRLQGFIGFPDVDLSYPLFLSESLDSADRIERIFSDERIGSRRWYGRGAQDHEHFRAESSETLSVTEDILGRLIGLPMAPDLSRQHIERVVNVLEDALTSGP